MKSISELEEKFITLQRVHNVLEFDMYSFFSNTFLAKSLFSLIRLKSISELEEKFITLQCVHKVLEFDMYSFFSNTFLAY